jgi:hypothetical protein
VHRENMRCRSREIRRKEDSYKELVALAFGRIECQLPPQHLSHEGFSLSLSRGTKPYHTVKAVSWVLRDTLSASLGRTPLSTSNHRLRITRYNPISSGKPGPDTLHQSLQASHRMCYWYKHDYTCKHVTYALGRYCSAANLIQTPCKKRTIWQTIRMGEECEECAMPEGRGNAVTYDGVQEQHQGGVKANRWRKR